MTPRPTKRTVLTLYLPASDDFGSVELGLGLNEWGQPQSLDIHYRLSPKSPPWDEMRPTVISPLRLALEVFDAIRWQYRTVEMFLKYRSCPECDGLVTAEEGMRGGGACDACIDDMWRRQEATGEPEMEL